MADDAQFYRARAEQERANAQAARLDNVRERCDRAATTWEAMAVRAEQPRSAAPRAKPPPPRHASRPCRTRARVPGVFLPGEEFFPLRSTPIR